MVRNSGKLDRTGERKETDTTGKLEDEVDALFRLPLAEFTAARNTLAARLKKVGRGDEADLVKALVKPSISAWTVNQLYWQHREAFDRLIESGGRFHKAQSSRLAGKLADMRRALDARREALMHLSDLATSLLRDAGHNPTPDTIRRITTTLEAMSVYASRSDAPRPGRLTDDVDPPGFELFGSSITGAGMTESRGNPARVTPSQKASSPATNTRRKVAPDDDVHQFAKTRKVKLAAAKVSLQEAKGSLTQARVRAKSLEAAQKKADAEAKQAEKHRRDAEERLEKAKAASEDAARRARSVAVKVEEAARAVEDAELTFEEASKELESLFRESSGR
jgi:pyruvate/2-oxoglutarate dehydrogenase complex dihydrolipoamide acyltransferase (E2) component